MDLDKRIKITGVKYGVVFGILLIAIGIISFYFLLSATKSPVLFIAAPVMFSFVITILLVLIFSFSFRKRIGGYWTFKQATTGIFIMFLTAYVLQTIGHDVVFAKLIEPDMAQKTYAATVAASVEMKKDPKVDKKRIDDNLAEIKKNVDTQKNISAGQIISGVAINIIMIFVFALIFGALFKKDPR